MPHNLETGEILNLADGTVWKGRRNNTRKLSRKHVVIIREELGQKWPDVQLPPLTM